jgi:hypothetical protein
MRNTIENKCMASMSPELCGLIILLGGLTALVGVVLGVMYLYEWLMV